MGILGRRSGGGRKGKNSSPSNPSISAGLISPAVGVRPAGKQQRRGSVASLYPYPEPTKGNVSRLRYGRDLAASIKAGTCPLLLTDTEVCAALEVKRAPDELPSMVMEYGRHPGRDFYRAADVRCLLRGRPLVPIRGWEKAGTLLPLSEDELAELDGAKRRARAA